MLGILRISRNKRGFLGVHLSGACYIGLPRGYKPIMEKCT